MMTWRLSRWWFAWLLGGLGWSATSYAAPKKPPRLSPTRLEWGGIGGPAVNVDTGVEIAGFVHLARFHPRFSPYLWRLRATFKFSLRPTPGGIEFPVHDYGVRLDLPGLAEGKIRLEVRAGFKLLIAQYYGLGNASSGERTWKQYDPETQKDEYIQALRQYQFRQLSPYGGVAVRWQVAPGWQLFGSADLEMYALTLFPNSRLEADARKSRSQETDALPYRSLLFGTTDHGLLRLQIGLLWDTRDNEFTPSRGWLHGISVRCSPGALVGMRYHYIGATVALRGYIPLWRDRLVLALRLVGDIMEGQIPFHRLTATGGFFANTSFGGIDTIRGVRASRYHGKAKIFGNVELRWQGFQFVVRRTYFAIGLTAFFDAGRVWLDYGRFAHLDGQGPGIHFGAGGGLRFQWGKSLIIRFDIAWSTDADPIGFYFGLGHQF